MPQSIEYFKAIKKYGIETVNTNLDEFKVRVQARKDKHRKGFIDTKLRDIEMWYCSESFAKIFKNKI